MELLQLRYFFESAKNESFSQTAEKHWVPASSVSASIKRLEEELGCPLFERRSNRVVLNENGKRLQKSLLAVFEELDNAVEDLKGVQIPETEIKILVLSLRENMIKRIVEYQKQHRNVRFKATFNVKEADPEAYDLIIDKPSEKYVDYERRELSSYLLCFRAHKDHPLIGKELTMKDLCHQTFVTMETEEEMNSALFESCKMAGFFPNVAVQTNDPYHYLYSTRAGLGISLWKKYQASSHEELYDLSVTDFHARQTLYLYHRRAPMSKSLRDFIDYLMKCEF